MNKFPFKMPVLDWDEIEGRPIAVTHDPIAYSCSVYRRWSADPDNYPRWMNIQLVDVEDQDLEKASKIRSYYTARLTMRKLRFGQLSKFGSDLYNLVSGSHNSDKSITHQLGMIYKLPYFYAEDQARDALFEFFQHTQPDLERNGCYETRILRPVDRIVRFKRPNEIFEYWWRDHLDQPVVWAFSASSGFDALVKSIFDRGEFEVTSYFYPATMRGYDLCYWTMLNNRTSFPTTTSAA